MFLTWLMSIGAAVIIFIDVGGLSSEIYHRSFGMATNVLCFIQPFMAAMRPHPGTPKRTLFNWLHWLVGNAAHICASKYDALSTSLYSWKKKKFERVSLN